jgi:hypothetical protein
MNNNTRMALLSAGLAAVLGLLAIPTVGQATTISFVQNTQGCTGNCGIDTANTVQVSDTISPTNSTPLAPGFFDIFVTLDTSVTSGGIPWSFQKNAGDKLTGHAASFAFSDTLSTLAVTVITPTSHFAANTGPGTGNPLAAYAMSPYNFPASGYGFSTDQQQVYSTLDLHVNTGIITETLTQFVGTLLASTDAAHIIFAADVYSGLTGKTGVIGFIECGPPSGTSCPSHQNEVPIPGALWLFGTVLTGAAGVGGWRRKKRNASAIIAA